MIALIPARSGSKGLKGKNIKELLGKPLVAYTIEEALKSKFIDEVIISTDCKEIEKAAKEFGAKSLFLRPKNLSNDKSKAIDNYIYTIDRLNSDFGYEINNFIVLQPTSPLRKSEDINGAIKLFFSKNADSVISYVKETHPITWHKYINDEGEFENIFKDKLHNRQDIRESYYPNGAIFIFKYNLIKQRIYYSKKSFPYVMPRKRSVDIDTIEDFNYAEFLMKQSIDEK